MPHEPSHILIPTDQGVPEKDASPSAGGFSGFLPLASNTTYTPNQFFDVCLPHCSRSAIRLVGYFIRRTLGWCDQYGQPQEEQVEVSFRELGAKAGVSRDRLRAALDEAIAGHFIDCVREGRPSTARDGGQSAIYRLRWHDTPDYHKNPVSFRGFFEREGNRTDIPNQYFDHLIPSEPLAVIKVVGSVIRSSIGFAAHRGVRRQCASLSYSQIQNFTRLHSRKDLSLALRIALERHYIVRPEAGHFTHEKAEQRSAVYALRWVDGWLGHRSGQKSLPVAGSDDRSEIPTSTGPINPPENRSENTTSLKTKLINETGKGAPQPPSPAIDPDGFSPGTASTSGKQPSEPPRPGGRGDERLAEASIKVRAPELWKGASDEDAATLVRYFYAGFHHHAGEPVSRPSLRERELAKPVVQRLHALGEGREGLSLWGRRLGELARDQRNPLASFALALRQCGDRLLAEASHQLQQRREKERERQRTAHRDRHLPAYLSFLLKEEARLTASAPDEYADFQRLRASELEQLRRNRAPWAEALARDHDTERDRLRALQGRFRLPGFWQWDAEHHDYPFNPQS